ncbi:AsmA-like C-terminal region-containing protein [Sphingomonas gilva]|uniref:AsmA-like C-terminal region-containing protein n=1 Tax=Sphingomonas gilva TaxID=2305907 RepID=UPI0015F8E59A|nr:AsmA-like C-terminal region-containing protein [Sphingomonas gilva]
MERSHAWRKYLIWAGFALIALLLLAVLAIAAAPVGWLKGRVEAAITDATGNPARIGSIERAEAFSFNPTIIIRDVRIAQPAWAGEGDLLTLEEARLKVPVIRAIRGSFDPSGIALNGLVANLIRHEDGRENWQREKPAASEGSSPLGLESVRIDDALVRYTDRKRDRRAELRVDFDERGLRAAGTGAIQGHPVRIAAQGAPITKDGGTWPFVARIEGAAIAMRLDGRMDSPLDTGHFTGKVTARGNSLRLLDAVIEAGLPATQPVSLAADIRRASPDWIVANLKGVIGNSDIAGHVTVEKRDGRSIITGKMTSNGFDFDDLSDDAGLARGRAKRARLGPRIIPDTDIDIANMKNTDGRIEFDIKRLRWRNPAPFRSLKGVLKLDNLVLTVEPVTARLTRGVMSGRAVVNARNREVPLLTLDLTLADSTLATFAGHGDMSGWLKGRARLTGPGRTVRAAIGRSNGSVGLVAGNGRLPARMASFIGLDIGRGVTTDEDEEAALRCLVFHMDVRNGTGRLSPLIVDTSRSQARVTGTIDLKTERLDWMLTGAPKKSSLLRYDKPLPIGGTIKNPEAFPPKGTKTVGSVLKMLGKAIIGDQAPLATNANCTALSERALR